jgi:hypothetical protein
MDKINVLIISLIVINIIVQIIFKFTPSIKSKSSDDPKDKTDTTKTKTDTADTADTKTDATDVTDSDPKYPMNVHGYSTHFIAKEYRYVLPNYLISVIPVLRNSPPGKIHVYFYEETAHLHAIDDPDHVHAMEDPDHVDKVVYNLSKTSDYGLFYGGYTYLPENKTLLRFQNSMNPIFTQDCVENRISLSLGGVFIDKCGL